jgi:hypothetical protein
VAEEQMTVGTSGGVQPSGRTATGRKQHQGGKQ